MAQLENTIKSGVETAFSVFEEVVSDSKFIKVKNDGWGDSKNVETPIRLIEVDFSQEEIAELKFSEVIQPTDITAVVPGVDLDGVNVSSKDNVEIGSSTYSVEEFSVDSYKALYSFLLRRV